MAAVVAVLAAGLVVILDDDERRTSAVSTGASPDMAVERDGAIAASQITGGGAGAVSTGGNTVVMEPLQVYLVDSPDEKAALERALADSNRERAAMDAAPVDYLVIDLGSAAAQTETMVPDLLGLIANWQIGGARPVQVIDRRD